MDAVCLKGTIDKNIVKGEMYKVEQSCKGWLLVECEDGVKRNFKSNRFRVIKWVEV